MSTLCSCSNDKTFGLVLKAFVYWNYVLIEKPFIFISEMPFRLGFLDRNLCNFIQLQNFSTGKTFCCRGTFKHGLVMSFLLGFQILKHALSKFFSVTQSLLFYVWIWCAMSFIWQFGRSVCVSDAINFRLCFGSVFNSEFCTFFLFYLCRLGCC